MSSYLPVAPQPLRARSVALWGLRGVVALGFLSSAAAKFAGMEMTLAEFDCIGLGQWLRYAVAFVELAGGLAVLVPRTSRYGAVILLLLDAGAFLAQVTVLHIDWIHTIVIAAVLGAILRLQSGPWR